MSNVPIDHYLILAAILFSIGMAGVLTRRNALVILMSVELMLNAGNLTLLAFARLHGDNAGHVMVFFVIAVAAAEAAVGLAIILNVFRHKGSINVDEIRALKQ
jgi:NADH-quinone oxidoreductase subunit K